MLKVPCIPCKIQTVQSTSVGGLVAFYIPFLSFGYHYSVFDLSPVQLFLLSLYTHTERAYENIINWVDRRTAMETFGHPPKPFRLVYGYAARVLSSLFFLFNKLQ